MKKLHSRGSRFFSLQFHKNTTYENIINRVRNFRGSILKTLIYRRKAGKPKMVDIVFIFHYSKGFRKKYKENTGSNLPDYWIRSEPYPPTMKITPANITNFAAEYLESQNRRRSEYKTQNTTKPREIKFYFNY